MYYEELETISQSVSNGKKETQKEAIKTRTIDTANVKMKQIILKLIGELEKENDELNRNLENAQNKLNSSMHSNTAKEIENKILSLKNDVKYKLNFDTKEFEQSRKKTMSQIGDIKIVNPLEPIKPVDYLKPIKPADPIFPVKPKK